MDTPNVNHGSIINGVEHIGYWQDRIASLVAMNDEFAEQYAADPYAKELHAEHIAIAEAELARLRAIQADNAAAFRAILNVNDDLSSTGSEG